MTVSHWLVRRGGRDGVWVYVRKLLPEIGCAVWTADLDQAHRFVAREVASYVRDCIVAQGSGATAVLPVESKL